MKTIVRLNNLRIAPRKVRLVADLVKGMDANEALIQLDAHVKGANLPMKKLILSALANAENNFGLDRDNLYVLDVRVGDGPVLKRWMPKAFGRAGQILKRTSKIDLFLEERVEGKNRKTKEQIEKEKEERIKAKREATKAVDQVDGGENKMKKEKISEENNKKEESGKKEVSKKGWAKKIFNRKSM